MGRVRFGGWLRRVRVRVRVRLYGESSVWWLVTCAVGVNIMSKVPVRFIVMSQVTVRVRNTISVRIRGIKNINLSCKGN